MSKGIFLMVFTFLLMMYILVVTTNSTFLLQYKAGVQVLAGTVEVQKKNASEWLPLTQNTFVTAGDKVRTWRDGRAELRWMDGTRMRLDPNTEVRVQKCSLNRLERTRASVFQLDLGKLWVRVAQALTGYSRFEIQTPSAVAAVRGTVFSVAATRQGQTAVEVYDGTVEVKAQRQTFTVSRQKQLLVQPGVPFGSVQPLSPEQMAQWQAQRDLLGPFLELRLEPDRFPVHQPVLTLLGQTEPQALVQVNGEKVSVDQQGRFQTPMRLTVGENRIRVTAQDGAGHTTAWERNATYLPPASVTSGGDPNP